MDLIHCCNVFPGSYVYTLEEVRTALWSVRAEWYMLGIALGLPLGTLQVIEGHAISQVACTLYGCGLCVCVGGGGKENS